MIAAKNRAIALMMAGMTLYGSLLVTAAVAAPPKGHKKPPTKKTTAKTNTAALIAAGKKVYDANGCANCHAINGKGGKGGPNLSKAGAEAKHTVAWFEAQVKDPKSHNPNSPMPAFGDKIKGKDLTALATYLKSLK